MEDLPLCRIAALVPEFAVKDLLLGRTLIMLICGPLHPCYVFCACIDKLRIHSWLVMEISYFYRHIPYFFVYFFYYLASPMFDLHLHRLKTQVPVGQTPVMKPEAMDQNTKQHRATLQNLWSAECSARNNIGQNTPVL